jgi:antirestriction protein ArdC
MKREIYDGITATIVAQLKKGVRPWMQPWSDGFPVSRPLRANGEPYRGINAVALWAAALDKGFRNATWMTFDQARKLNGHVRKGEQGTRVVYASTFRRSVADRETGEEALHEIPFLKSYTVFNAEQIEGLPARYLQLPAVIRNAGARIAAAETFFAATGALIRHGGSEASYSPLYDAIRMPPFENFRDAPSYYTTLAHEMIHWTAPKHRLNRMLAAIQKGEKGYAMEELVAELGSVFIAVDLGLTPTPREAHAAYIASWISALENDHAAIFVAAAHAQRAADFLHGLQPSAAGEG